MVDSRCEQLLKEEKYSELLTYCTDKLGIYPENEDYLFYQAVALSMLKDFEKSDILFTRLFNQTKKYFYLVCRGLVRFLGEKIEDAKADIHEAVLHDESYGDMLFIFRVATQYADMADAKEALGKALVINRKASLEELEQFFEKLSEAVSQEDRLLIVNIMGILKSTESQESGAS